MMRIPMLPAEDHPRHEDPLAANSHAASHSITWNSHSREGNSWLMDEFGDEPRSDADLIILSRDEPGAFTGLFDRHARTVHRYLSVRAPWSDVDDMVSETFVTAFRNREKYDLAYLDARPWLLGIATNILRHYQRATRRYQKFRRALAPERPLDPTEQLVTDLAYASQSVRVGEALANMDHRYRDVLLLVAAADLTYADVARALDIPLGTVRSRVARGRAQLRELLALPGQDRSGSQAVTMRPATEGLIE